MALIFRRDEPAGDKLSASCKSCFVPPESRLLIHRMLDVHNLVAPLHNKSWDGDWQWQRPETSTRKLLHKSARYWWEARGGTTRLVDPAGLCTKARVVSFWCIFRSGASRTGAFRFGWSFGRRRYNPAWRYSRFSLIQGRLNDPLKY